MKKTDTMAQASMIPLIIEMPRVEEPTDEDSRLVTVRRGWEMEILGPVGWLGE